MGIFRNASRQTTTQQSSELDDLRRSIQSRGQAKIPEAKRYVDQYLDGVADDAGVVGNPAAQAWLRDRMRMFIVVSWENWFNVLDRVPEGAALRPEWRSLCADPTRFGPEHLIAWWWLVSESLFRPLVTAQLNEMRAALKDAVTQIDRTGGHFQQQMVDWQSLFRS